MELEYYYLVLGNFRDRDYGGIYREDGQKVMFGSKTEAEEYGKMLVNRLGSQYYYFLISNTQYDKIYNAPRRVCPGYPIL